MNVLQPGSLFYHASYTSFQSIDLSKCHKGSDFGKGFYLTSSENQAIRFINAAIRKSRQELDYGFVLTFRLSGLEGLDVFEFATADADWLHCVCAFRRQFETASALWDKHDIIAGKVANDDTNATIAIYLTGGYGEVGSAEAVETALRMLKPEVLTDQICLKTPEAVQRFEFVEARKVSKK
jgi:hypothetical protein